MKLNDAIRMADALRDNAIAEEQKVIWINELEMKIQSLILRTAPDDMEVYALPEDGETELLVPRPFDKVYYLWLAAMIDYGNAEYDKYQNDKAMADAAYSDYAKWFMRHFHDDCGNVMYIGGTTKYGLSAYQIAVNHGFEGTEEEWLFSLNGKDAYTVAVEKGYEGTEAEFYAQLGVLNGIEERVSADAAAAEAAAERAETATQGLDAKVDAAETAAQTAVAATLNAPKIVNGTWWVYDAARSAYVDTGVEAQGDDGVSPTVSVTTITGGKRITITDANGAKTFDIMDGEDGNDGANGTNGTNGVSPTVSVSVISGGHRVSITDVNGTKTFDVMDGEDGGGSGGSGADGEDGVTFYPAVSADGVLSWTNDGGLTNPDPVNIKGADGTDGADGAAGKDGDDGVSPVVSVAAITGGHRITITDANGTKTVDVMDGTDGNDGAAGKDGTSVTVTNVTESTEDGGSNVVTFSDGKTLTVKNGSKGSDGAAGKDGNDGYTPVKGTDYFTDADKAEMVNAVLAALPAAEEASF